MALVSNIPTNILACCNSVEIKAAVLASSATVGTSTNHKLGLTTNDTVRATLDSSGNLGIGTDSPGAKLDVRGTVILNEAGGDYDVRMEGDTDANLFFLDASTDRIGIGTATPSHLLDVEGVANFATCIVTPTVCTTGNTVIGGDLTVSGDDITLGTNTSGYIIVADGTNYNPVAVSGDVTINSAGAVTIVADAVENSMLANCVITLADGDGNSTAVALGGTMSFNGTSNEVEVSESSGTLTVGLPSTVSGLTTVSATNLTGTLSTAAQPNITSVGTLTSICTSGAITAGGAITGSTLCSSGDLVVAGDDITMGTNTSGALLVADGTNFNPAVMSGDASISTAGAVTLAATNTNLTTLANVTSVGTLTGLTVSGDVTIDTTTLAVDSTNNRVGIGTATPSHLLDVEGVVNVVTCVITPVYCVSGEYALPASDGTTGQVLCTDGSGGLSFATNTPVSPGGSDTYVQFNEGGSTFGGSANFTWDDTTVKASNFCTAGTATLATVDINAGAIDGTTIGAASASTIAGTTLCASVYFTGPLVTTTTVCASNHVCAAGNVQAGCCVAAVKYCLSDEYLFPTCDGTAGLVLCTDGSGSLRFASSSDTVNNPGGSDTNVQFNDGGNFGGSANFTWDDTTVKASNFCTAGTATLATVDINAGAIDGATIGASSASTIAGTTLTATGNVGFDGGTFVFNESGADKDFRIEGDAEANLFITDASTDRVGIGTATPSHLLDVEGVAHFATCIVTPVVCTTGDAVVGGDLTIGGDDLTMGTNTSGYILVADGTNYNPVAVSGDVTISAAGAVTIAADAVENSMLANCTVSYGGVSLALGGSDATPAFDLADATNYPTSSLVGTITNAQLAGSIVNAKLVNDSVSFGGVSVDLGASDATPAFDLSDATAYTGDSSLVTVGTIASGTWQGTAIATGYIAGTLTSKTLCDPVLVGAISGNAFLDEDDMASDSASKVASQQSIKAYVDSVASGLDMKCSSHVATTANLSAAYSNGTSGVGATLTNSGTQAALSIDGETLASSERVLVKNQTAACHNGIYSVTTVGDGSTNWVITRTTDFDSSTEVTSGAFTFVETGSTNGDHGFVMTSDGAITIGTTAINWTQFSGAGQITAGAGMTKSGNTLNVIAGDNITVNADDVALSTAITGITSISSTCFTGTLQTAAQANITSVGTLTSLCSSGGITLGGDLTIAGDDLFMATNTSGYLLIADGTNYNPTAVSGDVTINSSGATTIGATTVTNAMLAGSIANAKLSNSSVSYGGISVSLGSADATPAFDLADATNYPTSSLVGTITNTQLAGSIANAKLSNSSVSYGGISVSLGSSDATPAFDLADATNYPTSSLVGTITNTQLAGSIANAKLANSTITVSDGSNTTAIALGGTATFSGTSNEIEVAESSGTVTIGLPSTVSGLTTISATNLTGTLSTAAQANVTSVGTLTSLAVSGDITIDTTTLKVNSTTNRVGIGTATPSHLLDVEGVANVATCIITPIYCVASEYVLPSADGSAGQVMCTDGSGGLAFATNTPTSPGGSDTYVQFNDGSSFGGSANFTWDDTTVKASNFCTAGTATLATVDINAGAIDGTTIGAAAAAAITGTTLTASGNVSFDGGTFIFNEAGADKDFRIEGDSEQNLFIADASVDRIGIGTATPSHLLDIEGVGHAATCFVSADVCATTKVVSAALCVGSEYALPTSDGSAGQILCTDGSGTIAFAAAASSGHTIAEEGTPLTARTCLNFLGAAVTAADCSGCDATNICINTSTACILFTTEDGSTDNILLTGAATVAELECDSSPTLGGNLDVNGNSIVSASNGNIPITPNGTGIVIVDGICHPTADGSAGQVLCTNGSAALQWATVSTDPAGSDTYIQFNNGGAFGGAAGLTWDDTTFKASNICTAGTATIATVTATSIGGTLTTAAQANITSVGTLSSLDVSGDLTVGTVTADGDTSSGDAATMGYTATEGIIITGQGSTNDVTIKNDADGTVISIPTGGTATCFAGAIVASGTITGTLATAAQASVTSLGTLTALTVSGDVSLNGGTFVFNEAGADKDFRIEGDSEANLFISDASVDRIGIGTATPSHLLDIEGVGHAATCFVSADLCATTKIVAAAICMGGGYALPTSDGTAGYILCTNGSGAISFAEAASSGHTIAEEGSVLASRTCLNFIGGAVTATDNSGTNATDVTVCATSSLLGVRMAGGTACCITLSSAAVGESLVSDTTPQLGGNLDVNGNSIISASNGNIPITPNGTGSVVISKISVTGDSSFDGGAFVFNESGADKDFRIEGDTDANLFIADASVDRIGIGTATPSHLLDVEGVAHVATCLITPKVCITSQYALPASDGSAGQILCTDGSGATTFAAAASSGHTIAEEGTALASRTCLNFIGSAVTATDNSGTDATDVTVCATSALLGFRVAGGTACCITLSSAAVGESLVSDTTPQLGGNLDVNGQSIVSASNGNIPITPNGSGIVIIDGLCHPIADGSAGQLLCTDGSAALKFATVAATSPGGSDTHVQFNDGGSFGGAAGLTWDDTTFKASNICTAGTATLATVDINAGAIDGTAIGANSASTIAGTTLSATGNVSFDGGSFIFNESGADKDFRIEGDTQANLFVADASTDRIGIGTATPSGPLEVIMAAGVPVRISDPSASTTASEPQLGFYGSTDGATRLGYIGKGSTANNEFRIVNSQNDAMYFGTNDTERMRITSAGYLILGGTAASGNYGSNQTMSVQSTSSNQNIELWRKSDSITDGQSVGIVGFVAGSSSPVAVGQIEVNAEGTSENAGFMKFSTATGGTTTERMRIDSSGRVGIGTASMSQKLDIRDDSGGLEVVTICNAANCGRGLYLNVGCGNTSHGIITAQNNPGTAMLKFTGDGKLGIGTTVPDGTLHVFTAQSPATVNTSNDEIIVEGHTNIGMSFLTCTDGVARITWGDGSGTDAYSGQIAYYHDGDYMNFRTASTERMRIDSTGLLRVIGTAASPTSGDGAAGVAYFTGAASDSGIALGSYNSSPWSNWIQSQQENGTVAALVLQPRGESVLFGYSGGSWANSYGTTLYNGGSAIYHVNGGVAIILRRGGSYGDIMQFSHNVGGSAYVGSISVAASSTAYNTTSDYRLKENVIDLTDATTRVAQLQPHRFNFIRDPDTTVDGFVAHEVSDIVPEAITGTKDEMRNIKNAIVDADGEILEEDKAEAEWLAGKEPTLVSEATEDEAAVYGDPIYAADTVWHETLTVPAYQGIDQAKLVPLLTAAIQELTARVEAAEAEIAILKG